MPYIHAAISSGLSAQQKRSLIHAITTATIGVLEVPAPDVHVFVWEIQPQNLGVAGHEPVPGKINNLTVVFRHGREPAVRHALIKRLTDVVQGELAVARDDIHVILSEVPPQDIGEGGILMGPPAQPGWFNPTSNLTQA